MSTPTEFEAITEDLPARTVEYLRAAVARKPELMDSLVMGWLFRLGAGAKAATYNAPTQTYFALRSDGAIKIGAATNPAERIRTLQTGSPEPLRLLASIPGGFALERELHKRFAASRISGEWFRPSPELLAYVDSVRDP